MFLLVNRTETLALPPHAFGRNIGGNIEKHLRATVEGSCSAKWGWTVLVTHVASYSRGKLDSSTGSAQFEVAYSAIVFRPFINEVLPMEVRSIVAEGMHCVAGPLVIFVSRELLPESFHFDAANVCFINQDSSERVERGSSLRVKILNLTMNKTHGSSSSEYSGVGQISEAGLGLMEK